MDYEILDVRPIAGALGAELAGVDLAAPADDRVTAEIRRALLEYLVIYFPDQRLGPDDQKAFTRRFGEFGEVPFVKPLDGHPEIIAVIKQADERNTFNFGGTWHSDFSFQERPPMASILYAREVPSHGGDTMFANMYLAYETLSDGMKTLLDGLIAVHSARRPYGLNGQFQDQKLAAMTITSSAEAEATVDHPVVRTHPETGRKCLFVNSVYTVGLKDMTARESRPLLDFLSAHAIRPEFTCRLGWRPGGLAMWDNRAVLHCAVNDYDGQRREMHRTTVAGDRPY